MRILNKLDNYISKITMLVPSAGDKNTYVQASDDGIMNGSDVRISMDFSFANGIVTPEHKTMTYQLPANIKISDVQSGKVKSGDDYVGDYTISTTGYVTITYDDSFVNDNRAFDGNLTFDCQASLSNEQVAEGISFSGNPTVVPGGIKIVPNNDAFDINAVKSITEVVQTGADKYITYSVVVSSTKGTRTTVDVKDIMTMDKSGLASLDTDSIRVKDKNGNVVSDYTKAADATSFSITGLPKLDAGGEYTITYTAKIDNSAYQNINGDQYVRNKITATSGTSPYSNTYTTNEISAKLTHTMLQKSSRKDADGNSVWTIVVNPSREDISGLVLKDTFGITNTAAFDSSKVTGLTISPALAGVTLTDLFGSGITFPAESNQEYTITYTYPAPTGLLPDNVDYANTVKLGEYDPVTSHQYYGRSDHLNKKFVKVVSKDDDAAVYEWQTEITIPSDGIPAGSYVQDKLGEYLCMNSSLLAVEGLPAGATISYYTTEDCSGTAYTQSQITAAMQIRSFQVTFGSAVPYATDKIVLTYRTKADYTGMADNASRSFTNKAQLTVAGVTEPEKQASYTDKNAKKLSKEVYTKVDQWNNWGYSTGYSEALDYNDLTAGYGGSGTTKDHQLKFWLGVNVDKSMTEEQVIMDELPKGCSIDGNIKVKSDPWNSLGVADLVPHLITAADADPVQYQITVPASYLKDASNNPRTIYLEYYVQLPEEADGTLSVSNKAYLQGDPTDYFVASQDVDYGTSETKPLEKFGSQNLDSENNPTNEVTYTVNINTGAKDLALNEDVLHLTDTMSVAETGFVKAELVADKIHLYRYDTTKPGNKGDEITEMCYQLTSKNSGGKFHYTLSIDVPDATACVLEYTYRFEFSNTIAGTKIANKATLFGIAEAQSDEVSYDVASSSSTAGKRPAVTIYKSDENDYTLHLEGARFNLEKYNTTTGDWENVQSDIEVGKNGVHFVTRLEGAASEATDIQVDSKVLYRLTETNPPAGYVLVSGAYTYFVFGSPGNSSESMTELRTAMSETLQAAKSAGKMSSDASVNYFISNSQDYKISNQKEHNAITVQKKWLNQDGTALTPSAGASVEMKLYKKQRQYDGVKVTVRFFGTDYANPGGVMEDTSLRKDVYVKKDTTFSVRWNANAGVTATANGVDQVVQRNDAKGWYYTDIHIGDSDTEIQINYVDSGWLSQGGIADNEKYYYQGANLVDVAGSEELVDTKTLSGGDWSHTWSDLDPDYYYQVKETPLTGYTTTYSANNTSGIKEGTIQVTNKADTTVETTDVSVTKKWIGDESNQAYRKTVYAMLCDASGNPIAGQDDLTLSEENGWTGKWTGLIKGATYTVKEVDALGNVYTPNGYVSSVALKAGSNTDFVISNTFQTVSVSGRKIWDDAGNQDGKRIPVVLELYRSADGGVTWSTTGQSVTIGIDASSKNFEFADLPKYNVSGDEFAYKVVEQTTVPGYAVPAEGTKANGYTITNQYQPETVTLSLKKSWDDENNAAELRPGQVIVRIYRNEITAEALVGVVALNVANDWKWTSAALPKYTGGVENKYFAVEDAVANYTTAYSGTANVEIGGSTVTVGKLQTGETENVLKLTITNRYEVKYTDVTVEKKWIDASGAAITGPSGDLVVSLLCDNVATGHTVTLNAANGWKATFSDLPVIVGGNAVTYSVKEADITGYQMKDMTKVASADGTQITYTITNQFHPGKVSRTVTKVWEDQNDQDGKRPVSVRVQLQRLTGGVPVNVGEPVTLNASNLWTYTWNDLDEKDTDSNTITYLVKELDEAELTAIGYTSVVNQTSFTITNTHIPEKRNITLKKAWNITTGGTLPATIKMQLKADGVAYGNPVVLRSDLGTENGCDWTYKWTGLPVYKNGTKIAYTVEEINPPDNFGATFTYQLDNNNGSVITDGTIHVVNSWPATSRTVEKIWNDSNNQDGKRASAVQVTLKADGNTVETVTLNELNGWKYTWSNLPTYSTGTNKIKYTVTEQAIDGYTTAIASWKDGDIATLEADPGDKGIYRITNTHVTEKTSLKVTKRFEDENNLYQKRPQSVKVYLWADGQPFYAEGSSVQASMSITIGNDGTGEASFTQLPKYKNGNMVVYTVAEGDVSGYTPAITYSADHTQAQIVNTYIPQPGRLIIKKTIKGDLTKEEAEGALRFVVTETATGSTNEYTLQQFTYDETTKEYTLTLPDKLGGYTVQETIYDIDGYICTGVTYQVDGAAVADGKNVAAAVTVPEGQDVTIAYEDNYQYETGKLIITKNIKGAVTKEEAEGALQFKVTENQTGTAKSYTLKDFAFNATTCNYILELTEKTGGYTVEETVYDIDGYAIETVKYSVDGKAQQTGSKADAVVKKDGITTVAFEDAYTENPGKLVITKTIKGDVTKEEAEGALQFTITNQDTGLERKVTLKDFVYDKKKGIWTLTLPATPGGYTVEETITDINGYELTGVKYTVDGGKPQDGAKVNVTVEKDTTTTVAYEDVYETKKATLLITKKIKGDVKRKTAEAAIRFTVTDQESGEEKTVKLTDFTYDDGSKLYRMKLDLPEGTYQIKESAYEIDGYKLVAHSVAVGKGEAKERFSAKVTVEADGTKTIAFTDKYQKKSSGSTTTDNGEEPGIPSSTTTAISSETTSSTITTSLTKTGDDARPLIWLLMLLLGMTGIGTGIFLLYRRRNKK